MAHVADRPDIYLAEFERLEKDRAGHEPAWLGRLRRGAIDRFGVLGFPTTRHEEWRFTSVAPIAEASFKLAGDGLAGVTKEQIGRFSFADLVCGELVFVNGRYAPHLSTLKALPAGTQAAGLGSTLAATPALAEPYLSRLAGYEHDAFTALNTAFVQDGAFLSIPPNAIPEAPIHLLFASTAPAAAIVLHPRILVVAGENSQVRIIESYAGLQERAYFTNAVTELEVGPNAVVDHYKLQRESRQGFHVGRMHVHLRRSSNFTSHSIAIGGGLVRNDVNTVLDGEGVDCTLNGLYLARGRQLVDNHTTIDHAKPHCTSHEVYKGILGDRAHAVFNGKIIVRIDAQKTDAKQTNKALLLSDDAQINTKPQLEIFANDVKCTHGAAVGQLDEDAIFYLRSRGLGYHEARTLLIHAFAGDVLNRVRIEALRAQLREALLAQLPTDSAANSPAL